MLSFLLANQLVARESTRDVINPYTQQVIGSACIPTDDDIARALDTAQIALTSYRNRPAYKRATALKFIADRILAEEESFAQLITQETGKVIRDSRAEVARAIETFMLGYEAPRHFYD